MTRSLEHITAALVALLLTTTTFVTVVAVPDAPAASHAVASRLA